MSIYLKSIEINEFNFIDKPVPQIVSQNAKETVSTLFYWFIWLVLFKSQSLNN